LQDKLDKLTEHGTQKAVIVWQ